MHYAERGKNIILFDYTLQKKKMQAFGKNLTQKAKSTLTITVRMLLLRNSSYFVVVN